MKFERNITRGNREHWPITLKVGLFRATEKVFHADLRIRPLWLAYLYIPKLFKFWLSLEKDVASVYYLGFIKRA